MIKNVKYFIIIVVSLSSCSYATYVKTNDSAIQSKRTSGKMEVKIYSTAKINQEYDVLGQVIACADAGEDATTPVDLLKDQARILGADAIINMRLEFVYGYWLIGIKANGTAVKFK